MWAIELGPEFSDKQFALLFELRRGPAPDEAFVEEVSGEAAVKGNFSGGDVCPRD
jgi:hypothetical protein